MLLKLSTAFILTLVSVHSLVNAAGCGGGGSYLVSDVGEGFPAAVMPPRSVVIIQRGSSQICIVNRAPNTQVTLTAGEVDDAVAAVQNTCCASEARCAGGQQKITARTGNVIDLSVQALGQDCTA